MACVLRAIGTEFDVDAFLKDSALGADPAFRRGEPRMPDLSSGPKRAASGFNVAISQAGFDDLAAQIQDALRFLDEHEDELRRLAAFPGVEEVCLDLAVRRRDVVAQSALLPAELLWRAGALDIDLVLTHYAIGEDVSERC
jgi:hypothetical protein